jgi:hypothetical protein
MGIVQGPVSAAARAVLIAVALLAVVSWVGLAQRSSEELLRAIRDARAHARTMPEAFGGAWLVDDGSVVFAFTHRATDEQIADVLGRIESWVPVTLSRVDWSEAEIDATKAAISDASRAGEFPFLTGIGTDIERNAVVVSIAPEWYDLCQAGLLARFGPVRIIFESSGGDIGLDSTPVPPASPSASLPPDCLPPPGWSPDPSGLVPGASSAPSLAPSASGSPTP